MKNCLSIPIFKLVIQISIMVLKLYYDLLSEPSRALYIFLKVTKIPFELCPIRLSTEKHLTEEFKKKYSKFQKVPFIHDGEFRFAERYLSREYQIPDNWYPKDSKRQAMIDEYLEWQHLNIRLLCGNHFDVKWLQPKLTRKEPNQQSATFHFEEMTKVLNNFQNLFLTGGKFMFGDEISYADLSAACEIEQQRLTGYDVTLHYPKIKIWMDNVRQKCSPFYEEAHAALNKLVKMEMQGKL